MKTSSQVLRERTLRSLLDIPHLHPRLRHDLERSLLWPENNVFLVAPVAVPDERRGMHVAWQLTMCLGLLQSYLLITPPNPRRAARPSRNAQAAAIAHIISEIYYEWEIPGTETEEAPRFEGVLVVPGPRTEPPPLPRWRGLRAWIDDLFDPSAASPLLWFFIFLVCCAIGLIMFARIVGDGNTY